MGVQAITLAYVDPDLCHYTALLGNNELNRYVSLVSTV